MLLVTQYLQGTQRSAQTWDLQRYTVQIALQLGVHSSACSAKCTPLEREIGKRSWFMCYLLDKYVTVFFSSVFLTLAYLQGNRTCSMTFGRPPSIPNSYMLLDLPLDIELEDIDEENNQQLRTTPQNGSTAVLYIQSMYVLKPQVHIAI